MSIEVISKPRLGLVNKGALVDLSQLSGATRELPGPCPITYPQGSMFQLHPSVLCRYPVLAPTLFPESAGETKAAIGKEAGLGSTESAGSLRAAEQRCGALTQELGSCTNHQSLGPAISRMRKDARGGLQFHLNGGEWKESASRNYE